MPRILNRLSAEVQQQVRDCLGYLNLSGGAFDPTFYANLNALFAQFDKRKSNSAVSRLRQCLLEGCAAYAGAGKAFGDLSQARTLIELVFGHLLPAYREFHADLLAHLPDERLFRPFFIARAFEYALRQGPPWEDRERIVAGALQGLNDYVGYRPVAVLHDDRKMEPYAHEWVCPIPLYVKGAGVEHGPYAPLVERALAILAEAPADILFQAFFDVEQLDELVLDPRAYDFQHPNHKRPNYLYGQWDLSHLDLSGRARRFVVQDVLIETLLSWVLDQRRKNRDEVMFEAAAVLAGTMLMGSGVSGNRPDAYDSTVTVATVLQRIADYRDAFYERLMDRVSGDHAARLRREAAEHQQPFGAVRKQLNQAMLRRRAWQMQQAALSEFYAEMNYPTLAICEAETVPAASVRMKAQILCRLVAVEGDIMRGRLEEAAAALPEIESLIKRAIECGALVDPWNILGFGGQYSLFSGPENSVNDERVDDLIDLVGAVFDLYVSLQTAAAAAGDQTLRRQAAALVERWSGWWRKYATTEVSGVRRLSGPEICEAARHVADALSAWHQAGAAAGDVGFWRGHVELFANAKAYGLVVSELFRRHDAAASMALLVHWLSRHEEVELNDEENPFTSYALEWMERLWRPAESDAVGAGRSMAERWQMAVKFIDFLEANADDYWRVPSMEWTVAVERGDDAAFDQINELFEEFGDREPSEGGWSESLSSAYDEMTFRDSADDGIEGETHEFGPSALEQELLAVIEEVGERLDFLTSVAEMWRGAALASLPAADQLPGRDEVLHAWRAQAERNAKELDEMLVRVHRSRIPQPRASRESLMEYDRQRSIKESLVEDLIRASVEMRDTARILAAARQRLEPAPSDASAEQSLIALLHAVLRGDSAAVRTLWPKVFHSLQNQQLLYLPPARGGSPHGVVAVRGLHCILRRLVTYLPRLGLLWETRELLSAVNVIEMTHSIGPGAITEFDQLFRAGCEAICRCVVESSKSWPKKGGAERPDERLLDALDTIVASMTELWLFHSNSMRLSVVETLHDEDRWRRVQRFIERYGEELFTQQFMFFGNLRAILLQGVDQWLNALEEDTPEEERPLLLRDLGRQLSQKEAIDCLEVIIESVVENYAVYIDYNTSTTQSDRGDRLYALLDFMRLTAGFNRAVWNMEPVAIAHRVMLELVRRNDAASWREEFYFRTAQLRREYLRQYQSLVRKHGMTLASVVQRIQFGIPDLVEIARLRAAVARAVHASPRDEQRQEAADLQEIVAKFKMINAGTGFELPSWLVAMRDEYDRQSDIQQHGIDPKLVDPLLHLPQILLPLRTVKQASRRFWSHYY